MRQGGRAGWRKFDRKYRTKLCNKCTRNVYLNVGMPFLITVTAHMCLVCLTAGFVLSAPVVARKGDETSGVSCAEEKVTIA